MSALAWVGVTLAAFLYGACGGPQEPGGAGDDCYRDADCKSGLVCVQIPNENRRSCSNDVSSLVDMVEGPPLVEMPPEDAAAPVEDAEAPPDDAATELADSGT